MPEPKNPPPPDDIDDPNHDPGDAVPEGVAPAEPVPLSEEDKRVKRQLEELPKKPQPER